MLKSCFADRAARAAAFAKCDIYSVISSEFCAGRPVETIFEQVAANGVKIIQLREKNRGLKFLYETAVKCRAIANHYGVLLMIDDHVDVALAVGADGVHLGQDDLPLPIARQLGPELWLGNSTHNLAEALQAKAAGADYINIGPIYPTQTKAVQCGAVGLDMIGRVAPQVNLPFSVMGGIKIHRFGELRQAGAKVLAMVTEITTAPDVAGKVKELVTEYHRFDS